MMEVATPTERRGPTRVWIITLWPVSLTSKGPRSGGQLDPETRDAFGIAALREVVPDRMMLRRNVIPHHEGVGPPLYPALNLRRRLDVVEEHLEQKAALLERTHRSDAW